MAEYYVRDLMGEQVSPSCGRGLIGTRGKSDIGTASERVGAYPVGYSCGTSVMVHPDM